MTDSFTARKAADAASAAPLEAIIDVPEHLPEPDLTENARTVLAARYLIKGEDGQPVEQPRELFWRVAYHIAKAEAAYGATDAKISAVAEEFYDLMATRRFMPNSPTLMNAGRRMGMLSACFVLPVDDSIEGIFDSIKATALIQKSGGGTGFDFSRLRPRGDQVKSSGGTTEGPLSFLKVFSSATNAIQQGAFRRGANMGMLRIDHPDVIEFIRIKDDRSQLTNYNLSVSVTQEFLDRLAENPDQPHRVKNPRSGEVSDLVDASGKSWTVGEVYELVYSHAWESGEPGMIFIDRINDANPTKHIGLMEATNPCGEQPLLPWEACNLGSINVGSFVKDGADGAPTLDEEAFKNTVTTCVRFLDDVVEANNYPLPQIREMCMGNRKIGLGVMGFADALYKMGIAYNSDAGVDFGEKVMQLVNDTAHEASSALASERKPFPFWEGSTWHKEGRPMRNACSTTVAPTGTISILADCSGGIEPMFSLAFIRQVLSGAKLPEMNYVFKEVAEKGGFFTEELLEDCLTSGTIHHREDIPQELRDVFVTAHDVSPEWHMRMQAAFQNHCDSSISKTINFAKDTRAEDVKEVYDLAIELGVKGVTVYRDGCRDTQPMSLKNNADGKVAEGSADKEADAEVTVRPAAAAPADVVPVAPLALPEIMPSVRVRQMTPFGNMHVKISVDPRVGQGAEREVFAQLGKGGDIANSDLEAICRLLSLFLRCGGSFMMACGQLEGIGSSLMVPTKDGTIRSLADGLAKALEKYAVAKSEYGIKALLLGEVDAACPPEGTKTAASTPPPAKPANDMTAFKVHCPECQGALAYEEGCVKCYGCGYSQC